MDEKKIFDIAIIGAGPAGSLLTMLLANQGHDILLIDKRNLDGYPPVRHKACGGLLAPDAQRVLASLNLNLPNDVLANPQLFSVHTVDLNTGLRRDYQRFYLNMDREKFDRYLSSKIPENVCKKYSAVVNKVEYENDLYTIHTSTGKTYNAKVLIGCDGAGSVVRKCFFAKEKMPFKHYYAIQHVYKCDDAGAEYYAIFDKTLTDYSGWAFPKDGTFTIGMAFPDGADGNRLFDQLIEKMKNDGLSIGQAVSKEGSLLLRPDGYPKTFSKNNNTLFLAGEAAGYVSPSSAEGFSFAFNSACALAKSFEKGGNISVNYRNKTGKMRTKLFFKVIKAHLLYNQFVRKMIMACNIKAIR
ncbi:MAG TPA: FAD-binding protein [Clostridia bacterium]|jgi:flavin-dependent dehydrogenase|nr:FAD-binding protein [Clostridia bacterium]HQC67977.1 FAD-binding protein [Clostridia bacterium]